MVLIPIAFRSMDIRRDLLIVARSEDLIEFAHMSLTKGELTLDVGNNKARKSLIWVVNECRSLNKPSGIAKHFASGSGVPALKLSFVVTGEGIMDEEPSAFILWLRKKKKRLLHLAAWKTFKLWLRKTKKRLTYYTPGELANHGVDLAKIFERVGDLAVLAEAISVHQRAIQRTPKGHADMPGYMTNLGNLYLCRFECVGHLADVEEAISLHQRAVQLTPIGHTDMPMYLNNLGNSHQCRFGYTGELSDISDAMSAQQRAVQLTPNGHADMPNRLTNLGNSYRHRFEHTGDLSDISEAIAAQQRAVQLTLNGRADMLMYLNNLGNSYLRRFERTGELSDISDTISAYHRAIQLTPNGHACMPLLLNNLGNSHQRRFERTGELSDISEAISAQQQAVQLTPNGHADMPACLSNLGNSYRCRFERTAELSDISEAISAQQQSVQLTPNGHAGMPGRLNNLGNSYQRRFQRTGDLSDISEAISAKQRAVQLTPNGHADMPGLLNNLGSSYQSRFERTGELSDISEAISAQQRAVQLTPNGHTNMPKTLNSLGSSYQSRFQCTGELSDISEAISAQQRAVQLTPNGDAGMPKYLNNLGVSYRCRFERTGELPDISEAISAQQQAVQLTPNGHASMPACLNNLGISHQRRFERTGELSDISEAISAKQQAVQFTPNGDADMPGRLNNLGNSYQRRFQRTGDLSDISEAISAKQRAVQLTPNGHADIPMYLNNLGSSFQCRFERTGELSDILEAISAKRRAVQLTPNGHTNMPGILNNLGGSYQSRFQRTGELSDISEAISAQQRAVQLTSNSDADMPGRLNNLGISYRRRFERTRELSDISEAISAHQQAIQLIPNGHADMPLCLNNLGLSFECRFDHVDYPVRDPCIPLSIYEKSATAVGPPSIRLQAARRWALQSVAYRPRQTAKAYDVAIDLLSQIAGMDRTIEQRHTHLAEFADLATSAASVAFMQGDIEKALEWLEQGRCLVWSQLNQLRTPVDSLREHDEHLAQRFVDISSALELSGTRHGLENLDIGALLSKKITLQDAAHIHVKLAGEWNQLLDEIRRIPRFHDFLRPPHTSDLLKDLPPDGHIIIINVDKIRCDALALISGVNAPVHIPLHVFTHKLASELRERLSHFLSSHRVRLRDEDRGPRPVLDDDVETQSEIHFILEQLWRRVVKPILDGLEYSVRLSNPNTYIVLLIFLPKPHAPLNPRRIWWCPTGPLVFLPLHAAGIYSRNETSAPGSCISDFAVSSYTPTVSALLSKFKLSASVRPLLSSKLLVISQPNTPGRSPIPGTTKEVDAICKTIGSSFSDCLHLEAEAATVSRVKREMGSHSSIHFACHASQDVERPLKSGFYLHDGRLELADIMEHKIAHSKLAFLSACQTSTGDENLSEEAVHLAAGMLAVGYRGVVATMWSIKDKYGPVVAESFYEYLMNKGSTPGKPTLDTANAARALHHAIQGIRAQVGNTERGLLTWVPYVHFGY